MLSHPGRCCAVCTTKNRSFPSVCEDCGFPNPAYTPPPPRPRPAPPPAEKPWQKKKKKKQQLPKTAADIGPTRKAAPPPPPLELAGGGPGKTGLVYDPAMMGHRCLQVRDLQWPTAATPMENPYYSCRLTTTWWCRSAKTRSNPRSESWRRTTRSSRRGSRRSMPSCKSKGCWPGPVPTPDTHRPHRTAGGSRTGVCRHCRPHHTACIVPSGFHPGY